MIFILVFTIKILIKILCPFIPSFLLDIWFEGSCQAVEIIIHFFRPPQELPWDDQAAQRQLNEASSERSFTFTDKPKAKFWSTSVILGSGLLIGTIVWVWTNLF